MSPPHVGEETGREAKQIHGGCQNFSKQSDAMPMKKTLVLSTVAAVEAIHFHSLGRMVPTLHYSNKG